jgi:hypothetical protein
MNIEELCNSDDIEIAQMYCNIYLQTHTMAELKKILTLYMIYNNPNKTTIELVLRAGFGSFQSAMWLKDPTRAVLINLE